MAIKTALRLRKVKLFAAAGLQVLYGDQVKSDRIECIQQLAWEINQATAGGNTRARLYIDGHGYKHYLAEQDGPTADALYTYNEDTWITEGERLALEIDQGQAATTVKMFGTGYWTESREGIVT